MTPMVARVRAHPERVTSAGRSHPSFHTMLAVLADLHDHRIFVMPDFRGAACARSSTSALDQLAD